MLTVSESRFLDLTEVSDLEQLRGGAMEGEKVWGDNQTSRPHPLYIIWSSMFMFVEHWLLHFGRWWRTNALAHVNLMWVPLESKASRHPSAYGKVTQPYCNHGLQLFGITFPWSHRVHTLLTYLPSSSRTRTPVSSPYSALQNHTLDILLSWCCFPFSIFCL